MKTNENIFFSRFVLRFQNQSIHSISILIHMRCICCFSFKIDFNCCLRTEPILYNRLLDLRNFNGLCTQAYCLFFIFIVVVVPVVVVLVVFFFRFFSSCFQHISPSIAIDDQIDKKSLCRRFYLTKYFIITLATKCINPAYTYYGAY